MTVQEFTDHVFVELRWIDFEAHDALLALGRWLRDRRGEDSPLLRPIDVAEYCAAHTAGRLARALGSAP